MLTSERSEKSRPGTSIELAKLEVEQLYPTISMPVTIALFDLGTPKLTTLLQYSDPGRTQVAYTPEFSYQSACTLRRIAWALNIPMTQAIERVFEHLPQILDKRKICECCRDNTRCDGCAFNQ